MGFKPKICVLHLTNACNLRCKHCYANAGRPLKNELRTDEIKNIIDQLVEMDCFYLTLSGGEPLLFPKLEEIAKYATRKGLKILITTNGTLLTRAKVKKLLENGVSSIQISFDSHIPSVHNKFRGYSWAFKNAINGMRKCKELRMKVAVMCTISKINYQKLGETIDFFCQKNIDAFAIERFVPEGRGEHIKDLMLSPTQLKRSFEILLDKKEKHKNVIITTTDPLFQFVDGRSYETFYHSSCIGGCSAGIAGFTITPDGYVTPCTRFYEKIGNIRKQSIKDIWENSPVFKLLRNRENLKGKCGKCKYKNLCGGCRAAAYNKFGDFLLSDPGCWL